MANVRLGSIVADIRGSVGDETYGRNRGGVFVRERVTPTDVPSDAKTAAREAFRALAEAWNGTLSEGQRQGWRQYGRQYLVPGKFGTPRTSTGLQRFIGVNMNFRRYDPSIAFPNAPPGPPLWKPELVFTTDHTIDRIAVTLPIGGYGGPRAGTRYWLYGGMPVTRGRNFYNGPWRFLGYNYFSTVWSRDPWEETSPWDITSGGRVFCYVVAQDYSGGQISVHGQSYAET